MGSIPLPALSIQPPQQPNLLSQLGQVMALRSQANQQQLQQQQIQNATLQNQMQQRQMQSAQALQQLFPKFVQRDDSGTPTGYDYDGLMTAAGSAGVDPATLEHLQTMRKSAADTALTELNIRGKSLDQQKSFLDQAFQRLEGIRGVTDPTQRQATWSAALEWERQNGHDISRLPQQAPDDNGLGVIEGAMGMHAQAVADMEARGKAASAQADAFLKQNQADIVRSWQQNPEQVLAQVDSIAPGQANAVLNARTKAQIRFTLSQGDVAGAKDALKQASDEMAGIEKETNPAVQAAKLQFSTAQKAAEQAISDGDPRAAAQLLIQGTVAPSQLISSRRPAFAQQAFTMAQQMQPGWNAQKADADFKVASSPGNVAFFGSAKSLTDKGGTLDQLADAAKDIPQGQIPVFNSIADAARAATGSGPVAKYASILLGVADDYSKVMGGGQGSDTSRTQALKLAPTSASPEARAAAIEGIRGAVASQINSRIGSNSVMQKMYGGVTANQPQTSTPMTRPPAGATHIAPGSDGRNHYTNSQGQDLGIAP